MGWIETKIADKLTKAYVDAAMSDNPAKVSDAIHQMADETDKILKDAGLNGTQQGYQQRPRCACAYPK